MQALPYLSVRDAADPTPSAGHRREEAQSVGCALVSGQLVLRSKTRANLLVTSSRR